MAHSSLTQDALDDRRSRGLRIGTIPFGFRLADDKCTLIACPEDLEAIARIVELREGGLSYREIANRLNLEGVPTKRNDHVKSVGQWTKASVCHVLRREKLA